MPASSHATRPRVSFSDQPGDNSCEQRERINRVSDRIAIEALEDPVSEVVSPQRLFLSSAFTARRAVASLRITHVVNLAADTDELLERGNCTCLHVAIADEEGALNHGVLEKVCKFVYAALAQDSSRVLVHCLAGVSRSASAVVAYLMFAQNQPLGDAMAKVIDRRSIVDFSIHHDSLVSWQKALESMPPSDTLTADWHDQLLVPSAAKPTLDAGDMGEGRYLHPLRVYLAGDGRLVQGSYDSAKAHYPATVQGRSGPKLVVNLCKRSGTPRIEAQANDKRVLYEVIGETSPASDLVAMLERTLPIVHDALKSGAEVLVHCNEGQIRSPTFVMLYLVIMLGEDPAAAHARAAVPHGSFIPSAYEVLRPPRLDRLCLKLGGRLPPACCADATCSIEECEEEGEEEEEEEEEEEDEQDTDT